MGALRRLRPVGEAILDGSDSCHPSNTHPPPSTPRPDQQREPWRRRRATETNGNSAPAPGHSRLQPWTKRAPDVICRRKSSAVVFLHLARRASTAVGLSGINPLVTRQASSNPIACPSSRELVLERLLSGLFLGLHLNENPESTHGAVGQPRGPVNQKTRAQDK